MTGSHGFRPNRIAIDPSAFVAPGVVIVGEVSIAAAASVWYACVLRGDLEPITIGARSNVQDGTIVHVDPGYPAVIGQDVTIGHRAVVHGCVLEDGCLIGMGAVILTGVRIGSGALVAAGAVVREGFEVPPHTLAVGVPARVIGPLDESTRERVARNKDHYLDAAAAYRAGLVGGGPYGG